MANAPMLAGREARVKFGWWYSHRFLLLRRLSQLVILALFLTGPWFGAWILRGNYSGSMLLGAVPLSDPLMVLQTLASGYLPDMPTPGESWAQWYAVIGGVIIALAYALFASRLFCGWVCPLALVTDLAAWLRRKAGIRNSATIPSSLRYGILLAILVGSAISGTLIWEWVNPVSAFGRGLINGLGQAPTAGLVSGLAFGFGASIWLIVVVFLFDLLVVEHGWCGHLCPVGALYGAIGCKGVLRVSAQNRKDCTRCMDCIHVCPEPQVLRGPLFGKQEGPLVLSKECISCGRCIDVCSEKVFQIKTRFHRSGEEE
ncbi:quinol dehydrogenase ferredoxin subunit NapH [Leminorella grimontii]|uniref:quinol dehydrogenase ferredoxin subunit NapH n=1 Tax=Leminorella grimontii TaxID=82981 RepID=UPI002084A575|nr:quinol dehydrogenase ferredoxin subunit NapH [Leminorella grimontii]GKX58458.1 ferredoxin-type protein NapH [Leminorella grimontii]